MTLARIVPCPALVEGQLTDGTRYAVEFEGSRGWNRYQAQTFTTWVGAASWIAAQGLQLDD